MNALERGAWEANILPVWAEEVLRERGESLSPDELYAMELLTTGDEKAAAMAKAKRWLKEHQPRG